jgi:hypothetical protein
VWILLLTSLPIMLFALGMERVEAALSRDRTPAVDVPKPDSSTV